MTKTGRELRDGLAQSQKGVPSAASDVENFLQKAHTIKPQPGHSGRLVFALDATMSRQPTWDQACHIQAEMFQEAGRIGGLEIKLVYFRGFGECRASRWFDQSSDLARAMGGIACQGGRTQIRKVLTAALKAAGNEKIAALVYVGDCMEEDVDHACATRPASWACLGVPVCFSSRKGSDAGGRTSLSRDGTA